jgi:hypothetical protein
MASQQLPEGGRETSFQLILDWPEALNTALPPGLTL